jgi:hypothetical protein
MESCVKRSKSREPTDLWRIPHVNRFDEVILAPIPANVACGGATMPTATLQAQDNTKARTLICSMKQALE